MVVNVLLRYISTHTLSPQHPIILDKRAGPVGIKGGANVTGKSFILENLEHTASPRNSQGGVAFCQCYNHSITRVLLSFTTTPKTGVPRRQVYVFRLPLPTRQVRPLGSCAVTQALSEKIYGVRGQCTLTVSKHLYIYNIFFIFIMYIYFNNPPIMSRANFEA